MASSLEHRDSTSLGAVLKADTTCAPRILVASASATPTIAMVSATSAKPPKTSAFSRSGAWNHDSQKASTVWIIGTQPPIPAV
jgi:hypothetical protein